MGQACPQLRGSEVEGEVFDGGARRLGERERGGSKVPRLCAAACATTGWAPGRREGGVGLISSRFLPLLKSRSSCHVPALRLSATLRELFSRSGCAVACDEAGGDKEIVHARAGELRFSSGRFPWGAEARPARRPPRWLGQREGRWRANATQYGGDMWRLGLSGWTARIGAFASMWGDQVCRGVVFRLLVTPCPGATGKVRVYCTTRP
jgi:hypothetical protein